MDDMLVYPAGTTAACGYGAEFLHRAGIPLIDHPSPEVTHLLLDVPSFSSGGMLRGGGDPEVLLAMLPGDMTVVGGNLNHPALQEYKTIDLLQEEAYLAENAFITADCALKIARGKTNFVFRGCPVLILGWGRIGKCLGQLLKAIGSDVTIAARKAADRAMLHALGYDAVDLAEAKTALWKYRILFNTAPEMILQKQDMHGWEGLKIDLASKDGIEGRDVLRARGLPGIHAPETSGKLIAETFLSLCGRA